MASCGSHVEKRLSFRARMLSPAMATTEHSENLCIIPQLPPPLVPDALNFVTNGAGHILAQAMQVDPDLMDPGRACEAAFRAAFAQVLIVAATRGGPTSMAEACDYLSPWKPAHQAYLNPTDVLVSVPGQAAAVEIVRCGSVNA
jgi:hypothetical protein